MKKNLLALLLFIVTVGSARADLFWYDTFNYADGSIETNSGGLWVCHSPAIPANDAIVMNHQLQVATTSGALDRQDDIHRFFPDAFTNGAPIPVYASFTLIVTNLPTSTGSYFAHFTDDTFTNFFGRVFALTGTPGSASTNFTGLPNTFRLGVAAQAGSPDKIFPVDLATNVPYQVVVVYFADENDLDAQLWVNPIGAGDVSSGLTGDTVTSQNVTVTGFAFRQASSAGDLFCIITNLATASTFDEAATNVAPTNAVAPTVVYAPQGFNGFVGVSNALSVVANGQSLGTLTYQWRINGGNVANPLGNTNIFLLGNPQTTDSGSYTVVVKNPATGLSVTSTPAVVSITFAPVPATITQQPTNTTVYPGQNATFKVTATGPGPITYQWNYGGSPINGQTAATLTVTNASVANGNVTSNYEVDVINPFGTTPSSNAFIVISNPPVVTINFIRGQVDPVFFLPTNTTAYYTTTGTVISKTNFTSAGNDELFISDGTGGISVFYSGAGTFRPNFGDVVRVTGPISQFNSLLEFNLALANPSTTVTVISSNNPGPVGPVLPLSFTNSAAFGGTSNALRLYGGNLVTFTNLHFPAANGTVAFASSGTYTMVDGQGNSLRLFVYSGFPDVIGKIIPPFVYTITGVLNEFETATTADRSSGYELEVSKFADFITNPPPAISLTSKAPGAVTINAVPYSYAYSVLSSTNASGPYLPLKASTVFSNTPATVVDTNITAAAKYYRVTSP